MYYVSSEGSRSWPNTQNFQRIPTGETPERIICRTGPANLAFVRALKVSLGTVGGTITTRTRQYCIHKNMALRLQVTKHNALQNARPESSEKVREFKETLASCALRSHVDDV